MAQINLLKQSTGSPDLWSSIPKILVRVLIVILILLISYYAWLFLQSGRIDRQTLQIKSQTDSDRQSALSAPKRSEVLTRQLQLKDLSDLISKHAYWSQIMPKLADATLKKATYSSLQIGTDGDITLSANVPSLEDMDKYMQVFDLPQINKYFSNIRIGGFHKIQDKNSTSIKFDVKMKYNPQLIQYNSSGSKNN